MRGVIQQADADRALLQTSFAQALVTCELAGASSLTLNAPSASVELAITQADELITDAGRWRSRQPGAKSEADCPFTVRSLFRSIISWVWTSDLLPSRHLEDCSQIGSRNRPRSRHGVIDTTVSRTYAVPQNRYLHSRADSDSWNCDEWCSVWQPIQ